MNIPRMTKEEYKRQMVMILQAFESGIISEDRACQIIKELLEEYQK